MFSGGGSRVRSAGELPSAGRRQYASSGAASCDPLDVPVQELGKKVPTNSTTEYAPMGLRFPQK